jgi:hypothetical protein
MVASMKKNKSSSGGKQVFVKHPIRSMAARFMCAIRRRYWRVHPMKWIICSWIWGGWNYEYEEYR